MIRRLFTAASALSLLVAVGAITMWVLGFHRMAFLASKRTEVHGNSWLHHDRLLTASADGIEWSSGDDLFQNTRMRPGSREDGRWEFSLRPNATTGQLMPLWRRQTGKPKPGVRQEVILRSWQIRIPCWCLLAISGTLPLIWLVRRYRRRRRATQNRCHACACDLPAGTDRCSGCGTTIKSPERTRATRHVFTIASVLSLVLCIGSAGIWIRSFATGDVIDWGSKTHATNLIFARGRCLLATIRANPSADDAVEYSFFQHQTTPATDAATAIPPIEHGFAWPGIGVAWASGALASVQFHVVLLPAWVLCGLTALLPGWWLVKSSVKRRQRLRRDHNLCLRCGYDLRASKDRCPECGTPIPAEAKE
ncbi:MAG TPA: hypothetical protein VGI81_14695 [Tepidisphaeraceae bacterium]|jgi:hypothetical protein